MITYAGFISEVRRLTAEARGIRGAEKMDADSRFRKWRNELEGVLTQIVQVGYLLPCPVRVKARRFGYRSEPTSHAERFASYQTEMDDTINELELVLTSYEKHGEPPKAEGKPTSNNEWPQRITLAWLYQNAPINLWVTVGAIAIAIFGAGVYVGTTDLYRKAIDLFRDSSTATRGK